LDLPEAIAIVCVSDFAPLSNTLPIASLSIDPNEAPPGVLWAAPGLLAGLPILARLA
jgi:hypothetical protein